jgi:CrcB protein
MICAGGALGTGARYATALIAARCLGADFPYGTLIVNLAGALIIGFVQQLGVEALVVSDALLNVFLTTGACLALCVVGMIVAAALVGRR